MEKTDSARIRKACDEGRLTDALQLLCGPEPVGAAESLRRLADFFVQECCGKCAPCREGTMRIRELVGMLTGGKGTWKELELIETLADYLQQTSLCHIGQTGGMAFESALELFSAELSAMVRGA